MLLAFTSISQVKVGLKFGVNGTDLIEDSSNEPAFQIAFSPKISLGGGFFAQFNLNEKVDLLTEITYTNKGAFDENGDNVSLNLLYLNASVLAKYNVYKNLSILLGPEFGYKLFAVSRSDDRGVDVSNLWEKDLDLGIITGLSFEVSERIMIDLRYVHGFLNVFTDGIFDTDDGNNRREITTNYRNHMLQFNLFYAIFK